MEEKKYVVYKHTCPNEKVYIGITSGNPSRRWRYGGKGYKTQIFYRAINKYGWDNINHEIIFTDLSYKLACKKERELIKQYNSNNSIYGYNMDSGGVSNKKQSEASKEKNRIAHTGKKLSEEAKQKISEFNKGKKYSDETKKKMSNAFRGRKCSELTKEKLRNVRLGTKLSEEHKRSISNGSVNKRKVIQLTTDDNHIIKIWDSIISIEEELHIKSPSISAVCRGKRKTAGGYMWRYAE